MKTYKARFKLSLQQALLVTSVVISLSQPALAEPNGEDLYLENCAICHGNDGQGGIGVPLSLSDFLKSASKNYIKQSIRLGRPNRIMPSFYWMPESEIDKIVTYLDSWRKSPAPLWDSEPVKGDKHAGKVLFQEKCASCHGKNARGGKGSGLHFSRSSGIPITPPALNNQGFLNSAPDAMLHYIILHGREQTPMPSANKLGLTKENINDLVSYIRSFQLSSITHKPLYDEEPASLIQESPYSFDETVENVKRAISGSNFVHIRDQALTSGFDVETKDSPRQTIIYFCNFNFLYDALKIDPRAGLFLPCRVTVTEHDDKVQIMSINPKHLSQLFNNDALKESCDKMHEVYTGILEDASL